MMIGNILFITRSITFDDSCNDRYMKITNGTVCDSETDKPYLQQARYFMANSTKKLEKDQPACACYIASIIRVIS